MPGFIRQGTAHTFQFGPFIDDTNGKDAETALTIAYTDIYLSKHGAASAAKNDTTNLTGESDARGYYDCVLNATDTGTLGKLKVMAHISGALPVWDEFTVLPQQVYDSLIAGSDYLDTEVAAMAANVLTAAAINADAITEAKIADSAIAAEHFAQGAADKVWSTAARTLTAATNITSTGGTTVPQTGDSFARIGATGSGLTSLAQASVLGALADAAADGDPTSADTAMQYLKQLINTLEGTAGIPAFPAESAPGNAVSLAEVIRAIHADVTGLNGDVMRGTDSAALASVCTEGRLAELDAGNLPSDIDAILNDTGTAGVVVASINANAITATAIQDAAIDAATFAANAITSTVLADNAITAAKLNADCITSAKIADDAIGSDQLATTACNKVFDSAGSITSLSFEALIERIYQMINNKMEVNESTGVVTLYDLDEVSTEATGSVDSDSGTTTRAELSWA